MGFSAGFSGFKGGVSGYETLNNNNFSSCKVTNFVPQKKRSSHLHTLTHTRARARTHTSDKADAF